MSDKVIHLHEPSVDEDLLEMIEDIVAQVKSTKITGLLVVACERGGGLTTYRKLKESDKIKVLGYMDWSKWCLLESIGRVPEEEEEEER